MPDGRLIVCATPIGNLGDVTARVLEALRHADVIQAEDTRVTRRLLARYDIATPLEPLHAHNVSARMPGIMKRVESGSVMALVSDAGTPGISDPGAELVHACLEAGLAVEVLPGPSAIVTALVASGLPTHAFYFGGFLPRRAGELRRSLAALAELDATLIFYESPRRTAATMRAIAQTLPGRAAAMARELTKLHEEVARGTTESLAVALSERELKGEVVLLVGPPSQMARPDADEGMVERVERLVSQGATTRDAVASVSEDSGVRKRELYALVMRERDRAPKRP